MKARGLAWAAAVLLAGSEPAGAQTPRSVGIVATLSGEATVVRPPTAQSQPLRFKDDVFTRDRISTAERSILRVLLGGKSLVTVRELSVLTIIDEPDRASLDVDTGKIALGILRQRMRPGEAVQVRTPNAIVAVRGTVVLVEYVRAQRRTDIYAIRDAVDIFLRNLPGAPRFGWWLLRPSASWTTSPGPSHRWARMTSRGSPSISRSRGAPACPPRRARARGIAPPRSARPRSWPVGDWARRASAPALSIPARLSSASPRLR